MNEDLENMILKNFEQGFVQQINDSDKALKPDLISLCRD
jgi:hypothetical protein